MGSWRLKLLQWEPEGRRYALCRFGRGFRGNPRASRPNRLTVLRYHRFFMVPDMEQEPGSSEPDSNVAAPAAPPARGADGGTAAVPPSVRLSREELLLIYQVVEARRLAVDSMIWQVPGLALTAQAFLVTIELSPGVGALAQITTGILAMLVSLMSIQLMLRHKLRELADSVRLERFEREFGWDLIHDRIEGYALRYGVKASWFVRFKSYRIWIAGLCAFGLVGLVTAVHGCLR